MPVKKNQVMEVLKQIEETGLIHRIREYDDDNCIVFAEPEYDNAYTIYFDKNDFMIPYEITQKMNSIKYYKEKIEEYEKTIEQYKKEIAEWVD